MGGGGDAVRYGAVPCRERASEAASDAIDRAVAREELCAERSGKPSAAVSTTNVIPHLKDEPCDRRVRGD